jgi:hypothetical protein
MIRTLASVFIVPLAALTIASLCGCGDDARLARMAETAADRQADQNKEMVTLNREVAEGTKLLVEADANSREDFVALQRDIQTEQAEIGQQRDQLESERREIAGERLRESILAPILANLGPLLVCALVLVFCTWLVSGLQSDKGEGDAVAEILIEKIVAERPTRLPPQASRHSIDNREPISPIVDQSGEDTKDE